MECMLSITYLFETRREARHATAFTFNQVNTHTRVNDMTYASNVLFQSACVLVTLTPSNRHLNIQALSSGTVDETSVEKLFEITEDLMKPGEDSFMTTWNLKNCQTPSRQIIFKCIKWALQHKTDLNSKNKRLAIVSGSNPVNAVVKLVLKAFGPSCPIFVGTNEESAFRFMEGDVKEPVENFL